MRARLRLFAMDRRANAATEFAFILPILLLFIGGIVELGRAFQAYNAVNRLATRYAVTYSDCADGQSNNCNTEIQTLASPAVLKNLAPQLTGPVTLHMFQVTMSSATPPMPTVNYSYGATSLDSVKELPAAQTLIGASLPGKSVQTGVVVTVSYVFQTAFFSTMAQFLPQRTISYTVAQRKN